jgi:hypothetical protein
MMIQQFIEAIIRLACERYAAERLPHKCALGTARRVPTAGAAAALQRYGLQQPRMIGDLVIARRRQGDAALRRGRLCARKAVRDG